MELHLHIVSFDIPYPPDYGGVIDVYYKIKTLSEAGIKIHLHCFEYNRKPEKKLEELCFTVNYYPRKNDLRTHLSIKPYIVGSRISTDLEKNLLKDQYPILFEGLHTCHFLKDRQFAKRLKIYRESNIEHKYYFHLYRAEKRLKKKTFFFIESLRLRNFQKYLRHADLILVVSEEDQKYLKKIFPSKRIEYMPSFHKEDGIFMKEGRGNFALYHGKLSVPENEEAARYLIAEVWDPSMPELVVAGQNPSPALSMLARGKKNIRILSNPAEEKMFELIHDAHLHIMVTFQPTGLKLKLLNALYNGRFCLVNEQMVAGTNLAPLCIIANTPEALREKAMSCFEEEFTEEMIQARLMHLEATFSNKKNCKELMNLLTLHHEKNISPR
ncbi:MAG: glycosyltransferase family 1 protein [Bacteroidetes bacterium]|nr:glycosyltransferase family 1 protein [Bacteroidota bacterium]